MSKLSSFSIATLFAVLTASTAQAGVLADGLWTQSRCGVKPVSPVLDLRNPDAYNKSVEKVGEYQKQINLYLDCVVAEANVDIKQISKAVTDEQLAARAAQEKLIADSKLANEKFDDSKGKK